MKPQSTAKSPGRRKKSGSGRGKASLLPIVNKQTTIQKSRMSRRRAAVLIGVHVVIAAHITHWLVTGSTITPVEPSEAMELSKHSVVNAGAIFFGAAILATAVFGRFFCGWGCHLVALQDASRALLERLGIRPRPLDSRLLKLVPLVAFVYMFLWPVAYRLWIRDSFGPLEAGFTTSAFWATFPGWSLALATFLACGFGTVYLLGAKGFCTYACPYGAAFGLVDRVAPVRIRVTDACQGCGHCTAVCTSNVRVHEEVRDYGMVVDPGCMKCMDCVSVCPQDALYVGWGPSARAATRRTPEPTTTRRRLGWGEELLLAVLFLLGFLAFRGLYGVVPFLFSLGIAACLAYLGLITARLAYRPHQRLRQWQLKHQGRLRPAGIVFLVAMAGVVALWLHSGWIRYNDARGQRLYAQTARLRAEAFAPVPKAATVRERTTVNRAINHLRAARDHGFVAQPRLDVQLAWLHAAAGDRAALEARASAAAGYRSQRVPALLLLARNARTSNRSDAAVDAYERAIAFDPSRADLYVDLATLWAEAGDVARAEAVLSQGLEANTDADADADAAGLHFNLGVVRALRGNTNGAIAGFERAVALDPDNQPARENLAGALASVGRYDESVALLRQALEHNPDDAPTYVLLAQTFLAMGSFAQASDALATAVSLDPSLQSEAERLYAAATGTAAADGAPADPDSANPWP